MQCGGTHVQYDKEFVMNTGMSKNQYDFYYTMAIPVYGPCVLCVTPETWSHGKHVVRDLELQVARPGLRAPPTPNRPPKPVPFARRPLSARCPKTPPQTAKVKRDYKRLMHSQQ